MHRGQESQQSSAHLRGRQNPGHQARHARINGRHLGRVVAASGSVPDATPARVTTVTALHMKISLKI